MDQLVGAATLATEQDKAVLFEFALEKLVSALLSYGKTVVLVTTIPQWYRELSLCELSKSGLLRRPCRSGEGELLKSFSDQTEAKSVSIFRTVAARHPGVRLIVPSEGLCRGLNCTSELNGELLYRDGAHFRRNLSEATRRELARLIGLDGVFQ
jgi:hypothetical protein